MMTELPEAPGSQEEWYLQVTQHLTRQVQLYQQLLKMAQMQAPLVEQGQADDLLRLLSNRQRLIDEITRFQMSFEPLKTGWDQHIDACDPQERQQIKDLKNEIESLLDGILQQDEKDRQHMEVRRTDVSDELQRINRGGAAHRAYGQAATGKPARAANPYQASKPQPYAQAPKPPQVTKPQQGGSGRLTDQQG